MAKRKESLAPVYASKRSRELESNTLGTQPSVRTRVDRHPETRLSTVKTAVLFRTTAHNARTLGVAADQGFRDPSPACDALFIECFTHELPPVRLVPVGQTPQS